MSCVTKNQWSPCCVCKWSREWVLLSWNEHASLTPILWAQCKLQKVAPLTMKLKKRTSLCLRVSRDFIKLRVEAENLHHIFIGLFLMPFLMMMWEAKAQAWICKHGGHHVSSSPNSLSSSKVLINLLTNFLHNPSNKISRTKKKSLALSIHYGGQNLL